jgi:hypothetical protein
LQQRKKIEVRPRPLLNREKRSVGILSPGDLAARGARESTATLPAVSQKGGAHSQSMR